MNEKLKTLTRRSAKAFLFLRYFPRNKEIETKSFGVRRNSREMRRVIWMDIEDNNIEKEKGNKRKIENSSFLLLKMSSP